MSTSFVNLRVVLVLSLWLSYQSGYAQSEKPNENKEDRDSAVTRDWDVTITFDKKEFTMLEPVKCKVTLTNRSLEEREIYFGNPCLTFTFRIVDKERKSEVPPTLYGRTNIEYAGRHKVQSRMLKAGETFGFSDFHLDRFFDLSNDATYVVSVIANCGDRSDPKCPKAESKSVEISRGTPPDYKSRE